MSLPDDYNASMEGGLFGKQGRTSARQRLAPLADRMRPVRLDDYAGQQHLVGEGRILRRLHERGKLPSMLFWGPPGTGKTTLARILATSADATFEQLSAVSAGVADLRKVVASAKQRWQQEDQPTVLFIDEIHRFNKAQQDAVLPHVEDGTVTLMGATTENPSFEVIGPLLSRCRVFPLKPLEDGDIEQLLERALADSVRGLGGEQIQVEDRALKALAATVAGDARMALTVLEIAVDSTEPDAQGNQLLTVACIEETMQHRTHRYDKQGDAHFDTVSAFIKSLRGSDVDGSLYWLARMLDAGEDPLFVVRRLVVLAAEDVGMADPRGLMVAVACQQAVHFLGLPEGFLPMAYCTIYLASAPKSNSALTSYQSALEAVRNSQGESVPLHLRNAPTALMKSMGHGKDYVYSHDHPGDRAQAYLPDSLQGQQFYQPLPQGYEKKIQDWYQQRRTQRPQ